MKQDDEEEKTATNITKRKRKTERELTILRQELNRNLMWTRESIKKLRARYSGDFSMSEQQIYKWWWDQTRKNSAPIDTANLDETKESALPMVCFQDEFGGYSSRLRHQKKEEVDTGLEVNLCSLLGINVEAIARRIAMGFDSDEEDLSDDPDNQAMRLGAHSDMQTHTPAEGPLTKSKLIMTLENNSPKSSNDLMYCSTIDKTDYTKSLSKNNSNLSKKTAYSSRKHSFMGEDHSEDIVNLTSLSTINNHQHKQ